MTVTVTVTVMVTVQETAVRRRRVVAAAPTYVGQRYGSVVRLSCT
ncbi:hypothetical protein [Streptomyces sp. NPDC006307]